MRIGTKAIQRRGTSNDAEKMDTPHGMGQTKIPYGFNDGKEANQTCAMTISGGECCYPIETIPDSFLNPN